MSDEIRDVDAPRSPSEAIAAAELSESAEPEGRPVDAPDWLPEKFATPEKFAEAYASLEREFHQRNRWLAEAQNRVAQLEQEQEQFAVEALDAAPDLAYTSQRARQREALTIAGLQEQAAEMIDQRVLAMPGVQDVLADQQEQATVMQEAVAAVDSAVPGWRDVYGQTVAQTLADNPNLIPEGADAQQTAQVVHGIVQSLRAPNSGMQLASFIQQRTGSVNGSAQALAMKAAAQSAVGAGSRPGPTSSDEEEWARIRAAGGGRYWES